MSNSTIHVVEEKSIASTSTDKKRANPLRLVLIVALIAGAVVALFVLPVKESLQAVLQWANDIGPAGPIVVAIIYVPACVLFLPGSVLTLGAGALFGVVKGTIAVSIGSTIGACVAFLVGRSFTRRWIERKVAGNPKFAAIDEAVGNQGFKIVFLTRLSPIFPFNMLNYAYGLTKVNFWHYAIASWIGMLPGTIMYVYLGSAAGSLASTAAGTVEKTPAQQVLFWIGLVATILVATLVTRVARKALSEATREEAAATTSGKE